MNLEDITQHAILPSVNVRLDGFDPAPVLENFYLSSKGAAITAQMLGALEQKNRARRIMTLSAPPGSGKSYLALFLGSLLYNNREWSASVRGVLDRASPAGRHVQETARQYRKSKERILPVYLTGHYNDLRTALMASILASVYQLELSATDGASEQSSKALTEFLEGIGIVEGGSGRGRPPSADKRIERASEKLAAPEGFFSSLDLILGALARRQITGMAIFHDEFNRVLIRGQDSQYDNLDFLQDLAEYIVRLRKQKVFLTLLTHKGISQYGNASSRRLHEWRKIEGRFHQVAYQEEPGDTYALIAHTVERHRGRTAGRPTDHRKTIAKINKPLATELGDIINELAASAGPLHVSALLALPLLSDLMGQNERTSFHYLADRVIPYQGDDFLRLPELYDYFDTTLDLMQKDDPTVVRWHNGRSALLEVEGQSGAGSSLEERILKSLTVITVVRRPNRLPGSAAWLAFCLNEKQARVEQALEELRAANLVFYSERNETYEVHYGSSIDIEARIQNLSASYSTLDCQLTMQQSLKFPLVYARHFNTDHYTLFYYPKVILLGPWLEDEADLEQAASTVSEIIHTRRDRGATGVVFFVTGGGQKLHGKVQQLLDEHEYIRKNALFVVSRHYLPELDSVQRLAAVQALSRDKGLIAQDSRVLRDLQLIETDLTELIRAHLSVLFHSSDVMVFVHSPRIEAGTLSDYARDAENPEGNAAVVNECYAKNWPDSWKARALLRRKGLALLVSELLYERYPLCPKINQELINRRRLTPNIRNARKKIIRHILEGHRTMHMGIDGYGPEVAILRSLFIVPGYYRQEENSDHYFFQNGSLRHSFGEENPGLESLIERIHTFFQSDSKQSFAALYHDLTEVQGTYSEVIPLYITAALAEKAYSYSLYENGRYILEVNSDVIERLHLNPDTFTIHVLEITEHRQRILSFFVHHFFEGGNPVLERSKENELLQATLHLLQWHSRLPQYTRRNRQMSAEAREFLDTLAHSSSPEELIFRQIPLVFDYTITGDESANETGLQQFFESVTRVKAEIENCYPRLVERVKAVTGEILNRHVSTPEAGGAPDTEPPRDHDPGSLRQTARAFLEQNQQTIRTLQEHDLDFRRFEERLSMPYDSDQTFAESLGSLLCDEHPRYWNEETTASYRVALSQLMEKLSLAPYLTHGSDSYTPLRNRIREDFRRLPAHLKSELLQELQQEIDRP